MKVADHIDTGGTTAVAEPEGADLLRRLVAAAPQGIAAAPAGAPSLVIGELVAMTDEGRAALVVYPGQPGTAAVRARSVVDLHGAHIGRQVVLMFAGGATGNAEGAEGVEGDAARQPIVMGVLRDAAGWPLEERPGAVSVDADGERLVVNAKDQLVLRCGKASITLTRAGKVLIEGEYLSSRSSGVNRIKGGSIQLN